MTVLPEPESLLEMTADIVTAMVNNNRVSSEQLPGMISSVHAALAGLGQTPDVDQEASKAQGAVSVRKSLSNPDFIISMIDGKPYKALTRHLGTHGYTAESYRAEFGLKRDYPMVAPSYAEKRRDLAKQMGLGRKKTGEPTPEVAAELVAEPAPEPAAKKPRRPRKT